jgi:hypothetical protein
MATKDKKKELKPPKPNKKNLVKTILQAINPVVTIPAAYRKYKKSKDKFKTKEKDFVKQEKDKVSTLKDTATKSTKEAEKIVGNLTKKQKKIFDSYDGVPGMSTKKKIAIATGLTAGTAIGAGAVKFGYDVNQEMKKMAVGGSALKSVPSNNTGLAKLPTPVRNKMGYMKKGGMAKKRVKSSSKKSRGTGAAIRGTKFKGVF